MSYGERSAWQRPHHAAYSSRAPSVERERPLPCSALRPDLQDCAEVAPAFRQKTLLPLDDVLGCLRDTIPNLSRSALHRCLQRHGISRLPKEGASDKRNRFKSYQIG
jgi:hypothetical protein